MASHTPSRVEMAVTALVSLFYGLSTAIVLEGIAPLEIHWIDWAPTADHWTALALVTYVVLIALPSARNWPRYARWEQIIIGVVPVVFLLQAFLDNVHDLLTSTPSLGVVVWLISLGAGALMLKP